MPTSYLFQDFGTLIPANTAKKSMSVDELEDLKLHAFESGFQAGWEEAIKAQGETETRVSESLASNLQSASLEYDELRQTLHAAVHTIMSEVMGTVLPLAARASLGVHICDLINSLSESALERCIEVVVAPGREAAVQNVLSGDLAEPFRVVVDPMMSPNQARLRLGSKEIDTDLDKTVAEIASAVSNFFELQKSEVNDG